MSATKPLTERQQQIMDLIREGVERGRAPTVREIAQACGIASPNGVMCHLRALEKKGHITRERHSRNISLVARGLPLLGRVVNDSIVEWVDTSSSGPLGCDSQKSGGAVADTTGASYPDA